MKFLGLNISRGASKKAPLRLNVKQPDTLIQAISEHLAAHGHWKVKLLWCNKKNLTASAFMTTTVSEFSSVCDNLEDYLREEYGAADFKIEIHNPSGEIVGSYDVPVAGPKQFRPAAGVNAVVDPNAGGKQGSGKVTEIVELVTALKGLMPESKDPMEMATQLVTVITQLSGGSSAMEEMAAEMMRAKFNNDVTRQETIIGQFRELAELQAIMAPKIPTEDTTAAVIGAIPSAITALMMLKGGGAPPIAAPVAALPGSGGNGAVDINALRALARSIPPEMINQLPADQQNALKGLLESAPPAGGVALPRPGVTEPAQPATVQAGAVPGVLPTPPRTPPANPYHDAIDAMVEEIREGLRGDGTDREAAQKILSMVATARGFTAAAPHPLLKGIMEATQETGDYEFRRFCAAVPELRADPERIDRIGIEIVGVMKEGAEETLESVEQVAPQEQPAPQFEYETAEQKAEATEDQHVSESPRIRSEPGPESESVQSSTDVEQVQQHDEKTAQAV